MKRLILAALLFLPSLALALDYAALAAELTAGHPETGAYSVTDSVAAAELNALNRDKPVSMQAIFEYLLTTRAHTNQGTDTAASNGTPSTILGRLILAAEQTSVPADPFGAGDTPATKTLNSRELHSAKAFLEMVRRGLAGNVNFVDTEQGDILSDLVNGGIMNTANKDAIVALSQNKQSRAQELGFGEVTVGDVSYARSL